MGILDTLACRQRSTNCCIQLACCGCEFRPQLLQWPRSKSSPACMPHWSHGRIFHVLRSSNTVVTRASICYCVSSSPAIEDSVSMIYEDAAMLLACTSRFICQVAFTSYIQKPLAKRTSCERGGGNVSIEALTFVLHSCCVCSQNILKRGIDKCSTYFFESRSKCIEVDS